MAESCKRVMRGRHSSFGVWLPGLVFVALGVIIVLEPRILAWVIAAGFVLFGVMLWVMAGFIRRIGRQFEDSGRPGA